MDKNTKLPPHDFKECGWETYLEHFYPDGVSKEEEARVKQAFYAGALTLYILMGEAATSLPNSLCQPLIKDIIKEIMTECADTFEFLMPSHMKGGKQ